MEGFEINCEKESYHDKYLNDCPYLVCISRTNVILKIVYVTIQMKIFIQVQNLQQVALAFMKYLFSLQIYQLFYQRIIS